MLPGSKDRKKSTMASWQKTSSWRVSNVNRATRRMLGMGFTEVVSIVRPRILKRNTLSIAIGGGEQLILKLLRQ